jgi:hypothetical protein
MRAFDGLVTEHEAMGPMVAEFRDLLTRLPEDPFRVAAMRWQLIRALTDHFAREESDICAPLVATGKAAAINVTLSFRDVQGAIRDEIMAYQNDWPTGRIERDWEGFCQASNAVLAKVQQRMECEENELYPEAHRLLA